VPGVIVVVFEHMFDPRRSRGPCGRWSAPAGVRLDPHLCRSGHPVG